MRESIKALTTAFSATTVPFPLPDDLVATIESFLDRYDDIDDHDSQRLHEDLHTLYLRHVASSPEKQPAFLSVLRLLRPAITGEAHWTIWWDLVLKPALDGIGHKRQELDDVKEVIQSILVYDAESDPTGQHARLSSLFSKKLLDTYLVRASVSSSENTLSPANDHVLHELESVLVSFGRRMPKVGALLFIHDRRLTKLSPSFLHSTSSLFRNNIASKH